MPAPAYTHIGDRIAVTDEIRAAAAAGAAFAFGLSGGKDGSAKLSAGCRALDERGHIGPRIAIHSDLGRTEHQESLDICRQVAEQVGVELMVVRRPAGDMLDRWLTRWSNNVERYANLACVKLILPWSTASMRFCTSELKTAIICRALTQRFPGQLIVSATGIRRDESPKRAQAWVSKPQKLLTRVSTGTRGLDWKGLLDWSLDDVWAEHRRAGLPVHPAYTKWGMSRVSCVFCILSSLDDMVKAATNPANTELYRLMVDLEIESTFSFHDRLWLADVPGPLTEAQREALPAAKARAARRQEAEAAIPPHLEYTEGWPTCMPSWSEARLLADVRGAVAGAVGLAIDYQTPESILARYEELMAARAAQGRPYAPALRQEAMSL
jgi:3'-phosphoadenosine 5'-phosphosulfate sulfotransferase (PAPS reductase)/FAD synthetase